MPSVKRKPSKTDVSRAARSQAYTYKKRFYQDSAVAEDYDFHRLGSPERVRRNRRKWRAIQRALAGSAGVRTILDLPCGTGRFTAALARAGYEVVGGDVSHEMMLAARPKAEGLTRVWGYVRSDAERLAFADGAFDCVMSIRFLFHVDPETRVRMLREMGRVARRWLILDYRHKYSVRYAVRQVRRALGLERDQLNRVSAEQMRRELADAGLDVVRIFPVARWFSDKWVVLCAASRTAERP